MLVLIVLHIATVIYLTGIIGHNLYCAHKQQRPGQSTHLSSEKHTKHVALFTALAALSFLVAAYSGLKYAVLSYRVWAIERDIAVPARLSLSAIFSLCSRKKDLPSLHLAQWLADTPVYSDALEIVAEQWRRFWWGQQFELGTVAWTMFLAAEGRRRMIPLLWAYALLAQLVSLSFAQDLFYVALLVQPLPLRGNEVPRSSVSAIFDSVLPSKPESWSPYPVLFLASVTVNYGLVFLLPYTTGTSWFITVIGWLRLWSLTPLVIPAVVPESWGTVHPHPYNPRSDFTAIFRIISGTSVSFHIIAGVAALLPSASEPYKHRHVIGMPFDVEEREAWERTTTGIGRIMGAMADHPAVAAVAHDVVLCVLSLGLWAAIAAVDVQDMLFVSGFSAYLKQARPQSGIPPQASDVPTKIETTQESASYDAHHIAESPTAVRRSSRVGQSRAGANNDNNTSPGADNDAGPKRRGNRKINDGSRSTYSLAQAAEPKETRKGGTYERRDDKDVGAEVPGDDVPPETEVQLPWESAALAWGMTALGGLGAGSAAVFGAEYTSH